MRLRWCRCLRLPVLLHANNHLVIKIYKKAEYIIFKIEIDVSLDISTSLFMFDEKSTHIKKEIIDHQSPDKTIIKILIQ